MPLRLFSSRDLLMILTAYHAWVSWTNMGMLGPLCLPTDDVVITDLLDCRFDTTKSALAKHALPLK